MTVGRISAVCWALFSVMSVAFLPLGYGFMHLHAIPIGPRLVLTLVVVMVLWWGPFIYGMYLSQAAMRNGDRRLLKRGIQGTAQVLSAQRTNTTIQSGEFAWEAPRVYKYELRVTLPGRAPYDTTCRICARGIAEGTTVRVAASPRNKKRVTIDVGQGRQNGSGKTHAASSEPMPTPPPVSHVHDRVPGAHGSDTPAESWRLDALAKLAALHRDGVLSDSQFEMEKARILA